MDLFGTKKRKAAQAAFEFIRPLIGAFQHSYGIPPGFWVDDFVLGFTGCLIGWVTKATGLNLSSEEKGYVIADTFTALSNENGAALARRFTELSFKPTSDFDLGADNATLVFGYFSHSLKDESDIPKVSMAKSMAWADGQENDRGQILGHLVQLSFVQVLRERFKLI